MSTAHVVGASAVNAPLPARRGASSFRARAVSQRQSSRGGSARQHHHPRAPVHGPSVSHALAKTDGYSGRVDTWPGMPSGGDLGVDRVASSPRLPAGGDWAGALVAPELSGRYTRGNPRMLAMLQKRVAATAAAADTQSPAERLRVYKATWDELADQLTLYRPLLKAIQAEYEKFLSSYTEQMDVLQPKVNKVTDLEDRKKITHQQARLECDTRKVSLVDEIKAAEAQKLQSEKDLVTARKALTDQTLELSKTKDGLQSMHEICNSIVSSIMLLEGSVNDMVSIEEREGSKVHEHKQRLDAVMRTYQGILDKHGSTNKDLHDVDEELRKKQNVAKGLTNKCRVLELEILSQQTEMKAVKSDYREVRRKHGQMQRMLNGKCGVANRPPTPRPAWEDMQLLQLIATKYRISTNQPTAMIVDELAGVIEKLKADVDKARDKLPWVQADKRAQAQMAGKWFVCRGTAPSVPRFLRMQGKVRNRTMQKRDCEGFLNEYWDAKIAHDSKPRAAKNTVIDFLYKFLKGKFGLETAVVEFGYNLVDALQRFAYDADCELFLKIINGELPEETYYDQVDMMDKFQKTCEALDKKKHGTKSMKKCLKREDFFQVLSEYFPYKTLDDKRALELAVLADQPLPTIYYLKLFEETRDGDQGKFAETIRDQHVYEVATVYPAIEECIRQAHDSQKSSRSSYVDASSEGLMTTVSIVKEGLFIHDKGFKDAEILKILAAGLGLTLNDAPFSEFRKVNVSEFGSRIRGIVIHRYSEPPKESDAERTAKTMRSLPESERKLLEEKFSEIDTDYSGTLTYSEMGELLARVYGYELSAAELDRFFAAFDSGEDEVDLIDYLKGWSEKEADAIITSLMETPEGASLESFKAMDGAAVEAAVKGLEWPGLDSSQLAKVQQAVVEARDDGDGLVTLDEFIVAISTKEELRFIGDMFKWKSNFDRYDADRSGFVDSSELKEMMTEMNGDEGADNAHMQEYLALFDEGGDGQVSWLEFVTAMKKLNGWPDD